MGSSNKAAVELSVLAKKQIKCYKSLRDTEQSFGLPHFQGFSKTGKDLEAQRWWKIQNCFSLRNVGLYRLEKQQLKGRHKELYEKETKKISQRAYFFIRHSKFTSYDNVLFIRK